MSAYLAMFAASCLSVFCRGIQQQNVIGGHYAAAGLTSFGIAIADVAVVLGVVSTGMDSVVPVGAGGAIGVTASMWIHRRMVSGRAIRSVCVDKARS